MNKNLFLLLFAAAAFAGCKNVAEPDRQTSLGGCVTEFTARATESKTSLSDTNSVLWSAGDSISLFSSADTVNVAFTLSSGAGTTSGTFTGTATAATQYWSVYPYASATSFDSSSSTLSLTLPNTQTFTAGGFASGANPMAAVATDNILNFKNLCGLLCIPIVGNQSNVKQLVIYDMSGQPLCGTATVDFTNGIPALTMTETNSLPLVINCTEAVVLSSTPTYFYAAVPPRTFTDGLEIIIVDDSNDAMVATTAATSVSRAGIRTLDAITYDVEQIVYYGTSNCFNYLSSSSVQTQSIDVTPYSTSEMISYGIALADATNNPSSAALLWTDTQGLVSNVALSGTSLSFDIGASMQGNSVVALYDSAGTVLWSFHIWVTQTALSDVTLSNGYVMLDRNLGANVPANAGLYYQWGRKDPFSTGVAFTTVSGAQTVAYSVANPTTYVTVTTIADGWYSGNYVSLWGNPFGHTALPGVYLGYKTVYDPCPAGYKVAAPAVYNTFTTSNFTWSGGAGYAALTSGTSPYPAAGFLASTNGTLYSSGTTGVYWTNAPYDYYNYTGSTFYIGGDALYFSQTSLSPSDWLNTASAAPVRCMQISQ